MSDCSCKCNVCTACKSIWYLWKKRRHKPGFDADLLIVDPEKEWEITSDSLLYVNKISAFVGMKGKGLPIMTMIRGNVVAEDGKIVAEKGVGTFIKKIK